MQEKREYPPVLLDDVIEIFDDLIGRFGHHAVAVGDEVYIQPCVYLSFHLVQMRAAGWTDIDFDQIAAVSGASALFAYEHGEFMPKYANLSIGMDERIAEATGFGYEWVDFKGIDGAWELIEEQLIYFLPPSSWEPPPKWDDTDAECQNGIKEQGYRARRRPDATNWFGMQFAPVPKCAMGGAVIAFFSFRKQTHQPNEHEVAIAVIRRAVSFARGNFHDEYRKHIRPGLGAFEFLIQILEQDEEYYEYEGGKKHWNQINCDWFFAMEGLVGPGFRKGASAFLEKCAEGFGNFSTEQKEHIKTAVRYYDEANAQMAVFMKLFESVGPVEEYPARKETLREALSSWEFRRQAVEVLRKIHRAENNAISSLEKLLEVEE